MSQAASGSIGEEPLAFATSVVSGAARQFVTFHTLDDLCPSECSGPVPVDLRPQVSASGSRQVRDEMPKQAIRAVHTPVAFIGLLLMPLLFFWAWRTKYPLALEPADGGRGRAGRQCGAWRRTLGGQCPLPEPRRVAGAVRGDDAGDAVAGEF